MRANSAGLALGELLGAATFITMFVLGVISIVAPFQLPRRPFIRDTVFFIGAIVWVLVIVHDGKITLRESVWLIAYYFVYVTIVIVGHYIYRRQKAAKQQQKRRAVTLATEIDPEADDRNQDYNDVEGGSNQRAGHDGLGLNLGFGITGGRRSPLFGHSDAEEDDADVDETDRLLNSSSPTRSHRNYDDDDDDFNEDDEDDADNTDAMMLPKFPDANLGLALQRRLIAFDSFCRPWFSYHVHTKRRRHKLKRKRKETYSANTQQQ
ncbi:hypothetical protein HK102_005673 [Quaeritorhiza haematococci]|nr:hypothetical protein HK102_005673 [Quaeritorhiza haematococci]